MVHWKETAEIARRLTHLAAQGREAALATVVHISGSAYRRPGAKTLIEETGGVIGSVSGGCLEADVRAVAADVMAAGRPSLRHYDTGDEDAAWGLGLGCNGAVDILVQPATQGPFAVLAEPLQRLLAGDVAVALLTVIADGPGMGAMMAMECPGRRDDASPADSIFGSLGSADLDRQAADRARQLAPRGRSAVQVIGGRKVFVEILRPAPHLVVCGAGADARPLVTYAAAAGFRVAVFDHRESFLAAGWFPDAEQRVLARPEDEGIPLPEPAQSLAVVKMHSLAHDREWVRRLLAVGYPYIGVLGPKRRTASILRDAGGDSWNAALAADRVFGPVGLDVGADGPEQVAISIVAELLAVVTKRDARHLSERCDAIHAG
jgi:xanthine/CO dehydrogenase XdhC/CoxF family maturation factor